MPSLKDEIEQYDLDAAVVCKRVHLWIDRSMQISDFLRRGSPVTTTWVRR